MRYLKPLRPFFAWSQLSIPTVYDDSLSYYEVLNKCIFHFNEMLKIMQENYEIIDEAFAKILEECEAAIARCEEAAARAEAAQSAAEKAQAAAEAAQAAAEAAQKLAEAAQAAAEAARDDAVIAQKAAEAAQAAAEAAQAAAEAAQAAAEAAQQKAETAQAAAEAAQAKAEDAQEKAESARDAAEAAQAAAEAAQQKAEEAQNAAESARDAAEAAQRGAEAAQEAAEASEQAAADSAADAAASAEEIKNALDNYYDKTESDNTFVKKAGDTMAGDLVMNNSHVEGASSAAYFNSLPEELTDLNNLNINGYFVSSENLSNAPNFKYYLLYNNIVSGRNHITQIAFQQITGNNIALRNYNNTNSSWSDWTYFTTQSDISGNYLPLSGGTMTGKINVQDEWNDTFTGLSKGNYVTTIKEESDLNDVKTSSINLYTTDAVISEGSKNFPDKIPGFLVSLVRGPSLYIRHIYYATLSNVIYTRSYSSENNSWTNWEKIATNADINNSLSGYLPLTGGTMTGNITMSADTKLIGNAETSDFFKLIQIPDGSDMNKIITSGFYAITGGDNVSNVPEEITGGSNAFSCFVFPWWYPDTTGIAQLAFGGQGKIVKGVYFRLTNNPEDNPEEGWSDWVRLDNVDSEVQLNNQNGIYYKISENNTIYKLEVWLAKTLNLTAFGYANTFTSDSLNINFENISELVNITKLINGSISYSVGFTTNSTKGSATVNSYIDENDTTTIVLRLISLIGGEEGNILVTIPEGNKILDCIIPKS